MFQPNHIKSFIIYTTAKILFNSGPMKGFIYLTIVQTHTHTHRHTLHYATSPALRRVRKNGGREDKK